MADPVRTAVAAGSWVKVATNVQDVTIHPLNEDLIYAWTYRATGGAAPTLANERVKLPKGGVAISSSTGVDVYIWVLGSTGYVRVDSGLIGTYLIDG